MVGAVRPKKDEKVKAPSSMSSEELKIMQGHPHYCFGKSFENTGRFGREAEGALEYAELNG